MANHRRYGALEKLSVIISKRSVAPIENELATRSRLGKGTWWWWWWWITGIPVLRGTRYVIAIAYARSLSLSLLPLSADTPPTILSGEAFRPLRENYRYTRRTRESFCHGGCESRRRLSREHLPREPLNTYRLVSPFVIGAATPKSE